MGGAGEGSRGGGGGGGGAAAAEEAPTDRVGGVAWSAPFFHHGHSGPFLLW